MDYRQKVRDYIKENLIVSDTGVIFADTDNIFEHGFVNSLFAMKLLVYIEQEFDIVFDDEDLEISNFNSVDNIVQLIERKKQK